jgi:hypothetical protein
MLAAGVALWAGADVSQARPHHRKKADAAAGSSASSSDNASASDAVPAQQPVMPQTTGGAQAPALVANSPTTTQYDPAKGFPDHNGPLSAMLIVIPKGELQEFDAPSGAGRHLDRVSRAEPGAQLAIKIVFTGVKPDWNANANVTYDLQVLGPDGKIYGHSDYKAIPALQSHVAATGDAGMYDNRPKVVIMQFEPQDQVGLYKIKAVLHDNVAKLDVPLEAGVELLQKGAVVAAKGPPAAVAASPAAPGAQASASSGADASMSPVTDDDSGAPKKKKRHHRH